MHSFTSGFRIRSIALASGFALAAMAGPALADNHSKSCSDQISELTAKADEMEMQLKAANEDGKTVEVKTEDGTVEMPADKATPVENWFGSPPDFKTVRANLKSASEADEAKDDEACMEHVNNARTALNVEGSDDMKMDEKSEESKEN